MRPDFDSLAFSFVPLCAIHFHASERPDRKPFLSDYRCQLRYADDLADTTAHEVRVYFVGQLQVHAGEHVSALLAFLNWEGQEVRCRVGSGFELVVGRQIVARGNVQVIARRGDLR